MLKARKEALLADVVVVNPPPVVRRHRAQDDGLGELLPALQHRHH